MCRFFKNTQKNFPREIILNRRGFQISNSLSKPAGGALLPFVYLFSFENARCFFFVVLFFFHPYFFCTLRRFRDRRSVRKIQEARRYSEALAIFPELPQVFHGFSQSALWFPCVKLSFTNKTSPQNKLGMLRRSIRRRARILMISVVFVHIFLFFCAKTGKILFS